MSDKRSLVNSVARERIELLFGLAEEEAVKNPKLSSSYISLLEKISTHYKVKLPMDMKNRICKACSIILVPGLNCKVVIASSVGFVVYRCNKCGAEHHIRYKS